MSSNTTGVCKATRIVLIANLPDKNYVRLYLHNVVHKKSFQLKFYINHDKDTPESIINEMKKDAHISISNPIECAKLLSIFHAKHPKETECVLTD